MTLLIATAGLILGHSTAKDEIIASGKDIIGSDGTGAVRAIIKSPNQPGTGAFASLGSVITLLFGASGVFDELHSGLNRIQEDETLQSGQILDPSP